MGTKRNQEPTSCVGKVYGKWTVLETIQRNKGQELRCRCECGTEKIVSAITIRNGSSKSCGCARFEKLAKKDAMTDPKRPSDRAISILSLIRTGHIPPADSFMHDGEPLWSFESIAKLIGASTQDEFLEIIREAGVRFDSPLRRGPEPV